MRRHLVAQVEYFDGAIDVLLRIQYQHFKATGACEPRLGRSRNVTRGRRLVFQLNIVST